MSDEVEEIDGLNPEDAEGLTLVDEEEDIDVPVEGVDGGSIGGENGDEEEEDEMFKLFADRYEE